jgi:hypothetical protein
MVSEFTVTVQVDDVPVYPPDQPEKVEFASGAAVSVTTVPALKVVPLGLLVTTPEPVPALAIVSVYDGTALKLVPIVWFPVILLNV